MDTLNQQEILSVGKRGMSIIEILIAMTLAVIVISGVVAASGGVGVTLGGYQSTISDSEINTDALHKAHDLVETASAAGRMDFSSVIPSTFMDGIYTKQLTIPVGYATQCSEAIAGTVSWTGMRGRTLSVGATTTIVDVPGMFALGGDCAIEPSPRRWDHPTRFASDTLNSVKIRAIDVLNKIAYIGADKAPYLYIADTHNAVFGQTSGLIRGVSAHKFSNLFNDDGKTLDQINDIDVAISHGRVYAYLATASTTAQLAVVDVTDIHNPVLVATRALHGITATDSTAWGWRVYYYDAHLYITTRETAGPELHVFSVSDPTNPTEDSTYGGGNKELNSTVNDFVVQNGIAYCAVDSNARGELLVYDVSMPSAIREIIGARTNFPGSQNGVSVFLIGHTLYIGRQAVPNGPELYILDAHNPRSVSGGLPIIGSPQEIGGDVLGIRSVGGLGFLVSSKKNEEFQVWNVADPTRMTRISTYTLGKSVQGSMDYESDFIYATGDTTPNFQILYSPI
jgi:hypothetical protein